MRREPRACCLHAHSADRRALALTPWTVCFWFLQGVFFGAQEFNQHISQWTTSAVTSMEVLVIAVSYIHIPPPPCSRIPIFDSLCLLSRPHTAGGNTVLLTLLVRREPRACCSHAHSVVRLRSCTVLLQRMFRNAYEFNQDISIWDVSSVGTFDVRVITLAFIYSTPLPVARVPSIFEAWACCSHAHSAVRLRSHRALLQLMFDASYRLPSACNKFKIDSSFSSANNVRQAPDDGWDDFPC